MQRSLIKDLLQLEAEADTVLVQGWVRTRRDAKGCSFLEINDGSSRQNLQVVLDAGLPDYAQLSQFTTGASVAASGRLVPSPAKGQKWELHAQHVELIGPSDASYPLQKKGHTLEYLREIAHLRPRSNLFGAVFRVRSRLAYAIHNFFQQRNFFYVHTPVITASDCEGAGQMFRVTTLDPAQPPRKGEAIDYERDFFARPTFLTVSGQLEAEIFACSLGNVYTFGPTFRAENSNTSRHASEFWMVEPEMAFCDLQGDMALAEEFVKYLIEDFLTHCQEDGQLFGQFVDKTLHERLKFVLERPFRRLPYTEAIDVLSKASRNFEFPVAYGLNLQAEHERYLTEEHFKTPVTVFNFPKEIKPFYMRQNDDNQTVAAMDVLVPGIGEIVGGSQREERLDKLQASLKHHQLKESDYWWYLDLRRYGSVPHSGFGLGFERMLMFVTGVSNIRDVIPFARTPGHAAF
jgi:asparaginyl-tRNA synthetase